uniref:Uncharacterized protein n=1 Tax=Heliothis virescens TaxID=7102 RepID=A0A2A4JT97_HELVI
MEQTKDDLRALGYDNLDNLENSEDEQSSAGGGDEDTTHIGDDICLEDLTDLSDTNEEEVTETKRESRKRGKGYTIKKNMKGETQLHVASISGNKLLVERLIAQGHPVNIRDNAGWLPLHEACIHGHVEVANILINSGANVNDRGGSNCDGITPLYDAASNGHLDVVQLLLEKGAIPSLKTDFGETPLHVLQKWRAGTILTKDQEIMYSKICNKIHSLIDKTNTTDILNRSKSKTPVKPVKDITPPSTSKMTSRIKELDTPVFKRRNIIDDDSDDDMNLSQNVRNEAAFPSDDSNLSSDDGKTNKDKKKSTGVKEYRNAIEALRNRSVTDLPEVDLKKSKVKPALLDPEEVDDDWLDDDLGINKNNKKRKLSDPLTTVAKKPSYESIKDKIEEINKISEPLVESNKFNVKKKSRISDVIDVSENSSDSDSFQRNENVRPKVSAAESMRNIAKELNETKSRDSRDNMKRRWKRQSTLLKAGFQRQREEVDQSSNSGSDTEYSRKELNKRLTPTGTFSRKSSGENFHYNSNVVHNDGFNIMQSMNPNIVQPMNVIQPINIVQSTKNGRPVQTQILPPAAVKVQVEDKVLLISLKLDTINRLTISWLVDEVKSRYYKLTGVRPIFSLMTSDGAILSEDDPLSLVLSSPELKTCITNWKASPAEERYLECCDALSIRTILTKDQEIMYSKICNKIHSLIDKTNTTDILNRSKSKTPVKPVKDITPPSTSKMTSRIKELDTPVFKRRNIIDDDSDDDMNLSQNVRNEAAFPSDDSNLSSDDGKTNKDKKKSTGVKEYRNAIEALRNRSVTDLPEVDLKKSKVKPALLDPEEVDDDWLDDDLGINKNNKKRKLSDPLTTVAKKPSYESIKDKIEEINKISEPLVESNKFNVKKKSRISDVIDVSENSSDSDSFQRNENVRPKVSAAESMRNIAKELNETKSRDSRDNMKRRWKRQSTLLKAGFQRQREEVDQSSNSGSDTEYSRKELNKRLTPTGTFSRKSSGENFHYNSNVVHNDGFNIMQSMNPNIVQPMNVIQPINIVQSTKNGRPVQTQILPPAAVKVQVEDKVLLISLKLDTINRLTISWLVDEVKSRYYKLTGVRPIFSLMTSDGAILSEDDPLSLVLSSPELKTCITNWKASPAEERYLECCDALSIPPSEEIQQAVGRSHTTRRLALGAKTLNSAQIRPLFRALTHQTQITAIMISDNNIGDAGVKYLTECLCTMKHLTHLDISRNNVTDEGTKSLVNMFERANRPACTSLEELDISSNPISDNGFRNIAKISQYIRLKVLKLNSCNITDNAVNESIKSSMNFDSLESIDLSNNELKNGVVSCLMTSLNPNVLVDLELDNVGVEGNVVGHLASFMDSAKDLKIRRFGLSNCKLVDGQFMRIFRSIGRAKHLQTITLKNNNLTFITLKKLLQRQPPVPQINLQGCQDIFKYSPDSDFQVWLPAIDFGRCIPEINVTPVSKTDEERESFKSFSKTWLNCFKGRGMIEHCEGGVIKFTAR